MALSKHCKELARQREEGCKSAKEIIGKMPREYSTDAYSDASAGFLLHMAENEPDFECVGLLLDWTLSKFWGKKLEELLPAYERAWEYLMVNNPSKSTAISHGDLDYDLWAIPHKKKKIVAMKCYCSCNGDDTHLFIYDKSEVDICTKFHIRTCWDRQTRSKYCFRDGWGLVDKPSINTYKRMDFNPRYGDFRDKGYRLSYGAINRQVDGGHSHGSKIFLSIWYMRLAIDIVKQNGDINGR